jgi:hypothetical protein
MLWLLPHTTCCRRRHCVHSRAPAGLSSHLNLMSKERTIIVAKAASRAGSGLREQEAR